MDALTLSTMVVLYNTNLKFDVTKLCELLPLNNQIIKIEKRGGLKRGESKRDKIKRRSKKEPSPNNTGFCHNSITTVLLSTGDGSLPEKEITIKIFQNGVFHMTGVIHELYHSHPIRHLCGKYYSAEWCWRITRRNFLLMKRSLVNRCSTRSARASLKISRVITTLMCILVSRFTSEKGSGRPKSFAPAKSF